jgi:intein-encoded DNA endonuclease-like protein
MSKKLGINIEDIISLYNQGFSPTQIAEKYNCSCINITKRLKKEGICFTRDYKKTRYSRRGRHKIDLDFFKIIDTEEKAYFLGIMYSDGSVFSNQFYLKLKDEDVVVKFRNALKCSYPIKHNEFPYYNYTLQISSKEMCNDLIKLGCVPNKTKIIKFPNIEPYLYKHFIRGFMDGDGCIRVGKTKGKCVIDFTSASYTFLIQLQEILCNIATHIRICKESKYDVWHLRCGGKQVQSILDWIYQDSTVYMDRKYFKYQLISSL